MGDMLMKPADSSSGLEPSRMTEDGNSILEPPRDGGTASTGPTGLDRKRKPPLGGAETELAETGLPRAGVKKMRLAENNDRTPSLTDHHSRSPDKSLISPEVWHHIFTFLPPKSLGNLLAVNKLFNLYLDPASSVRRGIPASADSGVLRPLKPNAIWQASRRLFWPQMPTPIRSNTELEMWRLACSRRCQSCGKAAGGDRGAPPNPRQPGLGSEGVTAIWAFGSHMCVDCLVRKSVKVRFVNKRGQHSCLTCCSGGRFAPIANYSFRCCSCTPIRIYHTGSPCVLCYCTGASTGARSAACRPSGH
jgi:hypothetical protein